MASGSKQPQQDRAGSAGSSPPSSSSSAAGGAGMMMPPRTPEARDSHDLSLSPRDVTRDSLVANMLLSLDQFSLDQHRQHQHESSWDFSTRNSPPSPPPPRHFSSHHQHQDYQQNHHSHYDEPFDRAPPPTLPWQSSTAHTSARLHDPASSSYHYRGRSYSSDLDTADSSSQFSSPPNSRGAQNLESTTATTTAAAGTHRDAQPPRLPPAQQGQAQAPAPAHAAQGHTGGKRPSNSSSSSSSQTATNEKLGAANAKLQAALGSLAGQQHSQKLHQQLHPPPVTPPSRGASLSPRHPSFDRLRSGQRRLAPSSTKPQDSYHQFLADTASSPASHGDRDHDHDHDRARRSKSAAGSSTPRKHAAAPAAQPPLPLPMPSSSVIDYDVDYLQDDYGAAPTPTVPGGPRRSTYGASELPPPPPEPVTPSTAVERRRSTSRTLSLRSSSGKNRQTLATARSQPPPPMPTDEFDSAPAPSVGYGKAKEEQHQQRAVTSHASFPSQSQPQLQQQLPPKEKPGFFRRVFGGGGSSRSMLAAPEQVQQPTSPRPPSSPSRPSTSKATKGQSMDASVPPSRDTSSSHSNQPPPPPVPPLQKKTSSFFRRRKKSVVDEAPPLPTDAPPVPSVPVAALSTETGSRSDDPSPVSSLRQALDPYLRNSAGSAKAVGNFKPAALSDITNQIPDSDKDDDESRPKFKRDFSPDYVPSPNARIRSVTDDSNRDTSYRSMSSPAHSASKSKPGTPQTFLDMDGGSDDENTGRAGDPRSRSDLFVNAHSDAGSVSQKDPRKDDTIRASKMAPRNLELPSPGRSRSKLRLPNDGKRSRSAGTMSTETDYKSATSAPPSVRVEDSDEPEPRKMKGALDAMEAKGLDEPVFVVGEPTEDDKLKAKKIYDGLEDFIQKDKAAAWMGEEGPVRKRTLQAYMELYNFTDQSILSGLRSICERLILRGETQQVDRILVAFSKSWCDCNPKHGFKATDIIHTICYSIMLLNTDLHLADIDTKMTRSQFVKNTLSTIRQALQESNPDAFQRPSILPEKSLMLAPDSQAEPDRSSFRHSFRPAPRPDTQGGDNEDSGPLVRNAFTGSLRAWEDQIEQVLKSIYTSIRDDRLPLFGAEDRNVGAAPSQSNLSVAGMLKRTPSVLSKAPSEGQVSSRGRIADGGRSSASRWTSKSRSRTGMGRNGMASSRTSFDDDNSLWSPAMSSATWSRYSLGRTQASMSQDSFASSMPRGDYQQSIGFANALSQSIFRDEDVNGNETAPSIISSDLTTQLLEDESLELAGPPWIKEGMVVHKHHLDGLGKRAKDRNWSEVFAVVQKGQLSLFSFSMSKSSRQKSRPRTAGNVGAPVGGGNWQDNAVNVGTFNLRLTLASALPSPGYSRTRPYVWALSLPTGAVHLFQVGTPEIIREFVNTANYWSARLSTHPLVGGISNIEYGWSDAIVNNALVAAINESSGGPPQSSGGSSHARKSSAHSVSMKSLSFDHGNGGFTNNSGRGKLPGDRVHIAPWAPPTQSVRPSNFTEGEQLEALIAYVKSIESDLQAHNQLRSPMLLAFTPRGQNAAKAMANWERKSSYLLREIVKFRTYVDCLNQAENRKREVYKERNLARRAARGELSDPDTGLSAGEEDEEGNETLRPE